MVSDITGHFDGVPPVFEEERVDFPLSGRNSGEEFDIVGQNGSYVV